MNSKDLRNISEAYQNIQEQGRPARRRKPSKSVEQIKAEIDARNPTQAGPQTGRQIPGTAPKLKVKPVSDLLPTKVQPPAPKPEFGSNATKPTLYPKPKELRPGGQTPAPEFKVTQPRPNAGGATVIPRTNANTRIVQPPAPKPQFGPGSTNTGQSFPKPPRVTRGAGATLSRGARLLRSLKGLVKGPAVVAAEIGAEMALEPVAKAGGDALTRTILDLTGQGNRARQVNPELYGKSGPNLTPKIVKGVQQRSKLAQQRAETQAASQPKPEPTGERSAAANAERQEIAKANAQRRRASAADFDANFAAARKAGKAEFTWRGKRYNTKLKGE